MDEYGYNAQLALDTVNRVKRKEIPSFNVNILEHDHIERIAGVARGDYAKRPEEVYLAYKLAAGICCLDQYLPFGALKMGNKGFTADTQRSATTGAAEIIADGTKIDSPEAVVEHLEKFAFPKIRENIAGFNEDKRVKEITSEEARIQKIYGGNILKTGYGFIKFPRFAYSIYGYENYFMAYALYPEVIEKHFSLQADFAFLNNKAAARAYKEGNLPRMYRLDHDMADSRGMLVDIKSLDRIWLPHFTRALEPMVRTDVRMLWHCDGNLMQLVPRLLDIGIRGFQGFQYEDGMDYVKICKMKDKDGASLTIIAGVSVTKTLPLGKPEDVKKEMAWLVENGPETGLFLAGSSSMTPGIPSENIDMFLEGIKYYSTHGR